MDIKIKLLLDGINTIKEMEIGCYSKDMIYLLFNKDITKIM